MVQEPLADTDAARSRTDLPADARARLLLSAATLDEKLQMVCGTPPPSGVRADGYVPGNERLGIPEIRLVGAGAGLTAGRATALPAPIGQAATWDVRLSYRCGVVIGLETRAQGANVAIGGDVNVARVPLNGRTFEAYGEDPFLAARMIVPHLRAIQEQGVIATVKHFALNNQETNRGTRLDTPPGGLGVDSRVDERTLRQIYLPAFEAAVKRAGVGVVMSAYNRVNGEYASQNRALLTDILKEEWGFRGWVVSDWWSTHSTIEAALAGLDQEMPYGDFFGEALREAVCAGHVDEAVIDDKAFRICRTMFQCGSFNQTKHPGGWIGHADYLGVAEDVAVASAVLLKNDGLLPLVPRGLRRVAVIGADADATAFVVAGGGSSHVLPVSSDTVLEALRSRLFGTEIEFVPGTEPVQRAVNLPGMEPVPSWVLRTGLAPTAERGLVATCYAEPDFNGRPLEVRVDGYAAADWCLGRTFTNGEVSSLAPLPCDTRSLVWEGVFVVPVSGLYEFDLTSVDGSRVIWDGELLIDNGGPHPMRSIARRLELAAGSSHAVRVEYSPESIPIVGGVKFGWSPPYQAIEEGVREAAGAAARADVAIVVARDIQVEGRDQSSLGLPNGQDRLIRAVAEANPRTVVVLQTGGPVQMPWIDQVPAILEAWYGGARAGTAIARLLTGQAVPSGKLPITFPRSMADLPTQDRHQYPGLDNVAVYSEGLEVGYRHYDAHGLEPLFPFGHGLSYTEFSYRALEVRVRRDQQTTAILVDCTVQNIGDREGTEIAQTYLVLPPEAQEPAQRLVGFRRVTLLPGESRAISVTVGGRELSVWDTDAHDWRIVPGSYEVWVGGSSRDQPLRASVDI